MTEVKGPGPIQLPPRKCQVHICNLHTCAVLSKCSQSYTICSAKAAQFSGSRHSKFVYLRLRLFFVSTHDLPPGLGREVILTSICRLSFLTLKLLFLLDLTSNANVTFVFHINKRKLECSVALPCCGKEMRASTSAHYSNTARRTKKK